MKQLKFLVVMTFIALAFISCARTAFIEKDPSIDLSRYKTYAWVDTKGSKNETGTSPTEFAKLSLHNTVNQKLQRAGWKLVENNPDVLVTYDILVERKVEKRNDPVYTRPFTRLYYNPYLNRWGTIYFPSRFIGYDSYRIPVKEATIIISMMDAKTDKKVWQGWSTQQVNSRLLSKSEINSSVNRIFKKFETAIESPAVARRS
jgi:hypothetical protein